MSNTPKVTELINSRSVLTDRPPSGKRCVAGGGGDGDVSCLVVRMVRSSA